MWTALRLRLEQRRRRIKLRHWENVFTIEAEQRSKIGITDASGVLQDGSKYQFQIAGRLCNKPQYFGIGDFPQQRIVALVGKPCDDFFLTGNGNTPIAHS